MGVHQFLAQFLERFRIFGREALVQMNVFSFNVPKIVKRFYQAQSDKRPPLRHYRRAKGRQLQEFCLAIAVRVPRLAMLRLRRQE